MAFAALAMYDSDSDNEFDGAVIRQYLAPAPAPATSSWFANYPTLQAMNRMDVLWGDLMVPVGSVPVQTWDDLDFSQAMASRQQASLEGLAEQESALWEQRFAIGLREGPLATTYDFRDLADWQRTAIMTYIYDQGWYVHGEDRNGVQAWPANLAPREWVEPIAMPIAPPKPAATAAHHHLGPKPNYIPRFCRDSPGGGVLCKWSEKAHCHYEHGDTIPRVPAPCSCTSPLCPKMHRGEVYKPGAVLTRPHHHH